MDSNFNNTVYRRKFFNAGMILAMAGALLLILGLQLPCIDFSHFHEQVDIQYNLVKVCKNVGLVSSMWRGIPYGIIIGIVMLVVLSFVRIPLLRLVPCVLILAMYILMMADVGNVADWINNIISKYQISDIEPVEIGEIIKSTMAGVYFLAAGLIAGLVSCFVKTGMHSS